MTRISSIYGPDGRPRYREESPFKIHGGCGLVGLCDESGSLMSGEVAMSYENSLVLLPHVKSGKVRALGVTGAKRSRLLPDLPTVAEAALPGYDASGWYGLVVPAATPKDVVARINAEAVRVLRLPEVADRLSGQGAEPVGNSAAEFGAFMRAEIDKWAKLVKSAHMKPE